MAGLARQRLQEKETVSSRESGQVGSSPMRDGMELESSKMVGKQLRAARETASLPKENRRLEERKEKKFGDPLTALEPTARQGGSPLGNPAGGGPGGSEEERPEGWMGDEPDDLGEGDVQERESGRDRQRLPTGSWDEPSGLGAGRGGRGGRGGKRWDGGSGRGEHNRRRRQLIKAAGNVSPSIDSRHSDCWRLAVGQCLGLLEW